MPRRTPTFTQKLTPDERREYRELLTEAGYDEFGDQRPSDEIGERVHVLLLDAVRAGREWATWALEDDARVGHLKRFKDWAKIQETVQVHDGERIVKRSVLMSVMFKDPETGERRWRLEKLSEMNRDQLKEVMVYAKKRVRSDGVIVTATQQLIRLLDQTGEERVSGALAVLGLTLDEALSPPQSMAA